MSDFEHSVCFLTSNNIGEQVPGQALPVLKWEHDRMIPERDDLQERLARLGIGTDIAVVQSWPENQEPEIFRARNPRFYRDENGRDRVAEAHFEQVPIEELGDVVIDRYSERVDRPKPGLTERVINPFNVQRMGYDKWWVHTQGTVRSPRAVTPIPTYKLGDSDKALSAWTGAPVIVKPRAGGMGKDMRGFKRPDELYAWLDDKAGRLDGEAYIKFLSSYIIQPEIDFTLPLPLQPFSKDDAAQFNERNDRTTPKEIGLYSFYHAPSDTFQCFPVPRRAMRADITEQIRSEWFFADPTELVEALRPNAHEDMRLIAKKSGATAIYGRKDYGFGRLPWDNEPRFLKIEDNLRNPYLMSTARHAEVGGIVRDMYVGLVSQLVHTATRSAS